MELQDIPHNRLLSQKILNKASARPEDIVHHLGAMQAQDYQNALWAIGLRCKEGTSIYDVQSAISERKIVRTWLMRGTLHFASASDIRWMLKLFAPRLRSTALKRDRNLGLSDEIVEKTKSLFSKALYGGKQLSRHDMYKVMEKGGVPAGNNLGYHMLYRAVWDGLICFGAHYGKQPTFALLDEWLTEQSKQQLQDKGLSELAIRYFTSHGPATLKDYVWWSGLKVSDARIGIEAATGLTEEKIENNTYYFPKRMPKMEDSKRVFMLPAFDEYLISYTNRSAILSNKSTKGTIKNSKYVFAHSNGIFLPTIIVNGEVVGTWGRKSTKGKVVITVKLFAKLDREQKQEMKEEIDKYGRFLETEAVLH